MKNRADLITLVKETFELESNKVAKEFLEKFEDMLKTELKDEGGFKLAGLTVVQDEKKATSGLSHTTNPPTPWSKPKHMTVKVKVSTELKELVYREL